MRPITHIVIHCTATHPSYPIEGLFRYWKHYLGWKAPGYHYLIDEKGVIHPIWPEEFVANGVSGHNTTSLHISYIGGINDKKEAEDTRTPEQKEALKLIVQLKKIQYPEAKVLGHRDFSIDKNGNGIIDPWERIKECPSFEVRDEFKYSTLYT